MVCHCLLSSIFKETPSPYLVAGCAPLEPRPLPDVVLNSVWVPSHPPQKQKLLRGQSFSRRYSDPLLSPLTTCRGGGGAILYRPPQWPENAHCEGDAVGGKVLRIATQKPSPCDCESPAVLWRPGLAVIDMQDRERPGGMVPAPRPSAS